MSPGLNTPVDFSRSPILNYTTYRGQFSSLGFCVPTSRGPAVRENDGSQVTNPCSVRSPALSSEGGLSRLQRIPLFLGNRQRPFHQHYRPLAQHLVSSAETIIRRHSHLGGVHSRLCRIQTMNLRDLHGTRVLRGLWKVLSTTARIISCSVKVQTCWLIRYSDHHRQQNLSAEGYFLSTTQK